MFAGVVLNLSISYLYATLGSYSSNRATVDISETDHGSYGHRAQRRLHTPGRAGGKAAVSAWNPGQSSTSEAESLYSFLSV